MTPYVWHNTKPSSTLRLLRESLDPLHPQSAPNSRALADSAGSTRQVPATHTQSTAAAGLELGTVAWLHEAAPHPSPCSFVWFNQLPQFVVNHLIPSCSQTRVLTLECRYLLHHPAWDLTYALSRASFMKRPWSTSSGWSSSGVSWSSSASSLTWKEKKRKENNVRNRR